MHFSKMKFTFFLLFLSFFHLSLQTDRPWCWTQPVKPGKQIITSKNGGENWGFCQAAEQSQKTIYKVTVETSGIDGSDSRDPIYLQIQGEEGSTNEFLLSNTGFATGSTTMVKVKAKNVGDLTKLKIRTTGNDQYRCNQIRIETGSRFWDFDCNDFLACPKQCTETLFLAGNQRYVVTAKTSNDVFSESVSPIFIEFIGVLGKTTKKILSEHGFKRGDTEEITIQTQDVGTIYGIVISLYKSDNWTPEEIIVKRAGREVSKFLAKGQSIKCPLQCSISLMNPKPGEDQENKEKENEKEESKAAEEGGSDDAGGSGGNPTGETKDASSNEELDNNYKGGALSPSESDKIIELTCETSLKGNADFGPKFFDYHVNFQSFIVICPKDCWKAGSTQIFGTAIHPEESSICRSALVDRSMPLTGGLVGVGITYGLPGYQKGKEPIDGLEIKEHKTSPRSFFTYKIDNPDFMASDMRIVDTNGNPGFSGRLEFRLNGKWGTVCSKKMSRSAAKKICQELKFADGDIKNPIDQEAESKGFCRFFKGDDFCGPNPMSIHYMAMNCDGTAGDIMKCYREIADKSVCSHDDDVIIECGNTNYDLPQEPLPGTVRVVDYTNAPSSEGSGRLEVYMSGKWGSICNHKFDDKASHVACRQMGYLTGKLIGNKDQSGTCLKFKGKNHCGNTDIRINLNQVECAGSESKIRLCGGTSNSNDCNHEQDVILQCEGSNGDPSGKSQMPSPPVVSPQYGKLALVPVINAHCKTRFSEAIFRGDVGSIFLVNCPADCGETGGVIWGTSIYTSNSAICRAAIHAGVIQSSIGGIVEVVKKTGMKNYVTTNIRNVLSTVYGFWCHSFVITTPNTIALKLSQKIGGSPQSAPAFLQLTSTSTSTEGELESPTFKWFPPNPAFLFNGKDTNVKTQGFPGEDKLSQLSSLSIVIQFSLSSKVKKQEETLISHSGCGGYALVITEKHELVFGERCSENLFYSGYFVPVNTIITVIITYNTRAVEFYVDGKLVNRQLKSFLFKCPGLFTIGTYAENTDEVFNGRINFLLIFNVAISKNTINKLSSNGVEKPKHGDDLKNVFTSDNRLCLTKCTSNPIPGTPGCPEPPAGAQTGQGDYGDRGNVQEGLDDTDKGGDSNNNGDGGNSDGSNGDNSNPGKEDTASEITNNELKCELPASDAKFNGPSGKTFRLSCPKNCANHPEGNVMGHLIYSDDSSVCKAAIHAGFLKNSEGGEFILEISNGIAQYEGTARNGVTSASRGPNTRSFVIKDAPTLMSVGCEETAGSVRFSGISGTKYTVQCQSDCALKEHKVWGSGPFTDDSSICQAAILAGALSDKGGEVAFVIADGQSNYKGGTFNGIRSVSRDNHIRSFKVLGTAKTSCKYFTEKYTDTNILNNWKVVNAKGLSKSGGGQWTFSPNPNTYGLNIKQSSNTMGSEYNYGTKLLSKNFECGEGIFLINVFTLHEKQGAILFRYSDDNNFYAIEFNQPGDQKLRLVKKFQGAGSVLKSKNEPLLAKTWYRFKISFFKDNIEVYIQKGFFRNTELLFKIKDNDVQRGTVGMATNGNNEVFFDGVDVHHFDTKFGVFGKGTKEVRIWDNCLNGGNEGHIKKYCKGIYNSYTEGRRRCEILHNYCEICCDRTIPKLENVVNYACWKGCVKASRESKKRVAEENSSTLNDVENLKWIPAINDKIDFKPNAEKSYFVPGTIARFEKLKKVNKTEIQKYKATVSFSFDNNSKSEEIEWPIENLVKCGEALPGRTDC